MKLRSLLKGDIRFQYKYGFYFIYLLFTILYIGLIGALPAAWREKAALLMIFTDPSAMGLYFMGALVLYEKSERVLDSLSVSPVKPWEYTASKLVSIGIISAAVGLLIGIPAGAVMNPALFLIGVFLCSCLFSAVGLIVACKTVTLNQFILATVPAELLINIPAAAWIFGYRDGWLALHPGVAMLALCSGAGRILPALLSLLLWTSAFGVLACSAVGKMLRSLGGAKL